MDAGVSCGCSDIDGWSDAGVDAVAAGRFAEQAVVEAGGCGGGCDLDRSSAANCGVQDAAALDVDCSCTSDFDGGFGLQHTPIEINTIADLHKLVPLLDKKGYNTADIAAILGQNWHRFLAKNLP